MCCGWNSLPGSPPFEFLTDKFQGLYDVFIGQAFGQSWQVVDTIFIVRNTPLPGRLCSWRHALLYLGTPRNCCFQSYDALKVVSSTLGAYP